MNKLSAGILFYKILQNQLQIFLVHPGGPFWSMKDLGAWSIPKGLVEEGEDLKETAIRETTEELGIELDIDKEKLVDLGQVKMRSGKIIQAFAYETDFGNIQVRSNLIEVDWPPKSGKKLKIPEVDRGEWFDLNTAQIKINSTQKEFLDRLQNTKY